MVFFNCMACGESLKKNQVEKHYKFKCRNCNVLACVDCGKEFVGDGYAQHTKCMTEDEKYGGKDYTPKPNANKGERKQEEWFLQVQQAIDKAKTNAKLKGVLQKLKDYPNIPRKQAKFENFLTNSLRVAPGLTSEVWNAISAELPNKNVKQVETQSGAGETAEEIIQEHNIANDEGEKSAKPKKNKRERKEERKEKQRAGKKKKTDENCETNKEPKNMEEVKKKKKKRKQSFDEEEAEEIQPKKTKKTFNSSTNKTETSEEPCEAMEASNMETDDENANGTDRKKFEWEATIIGVLKKAADHELSVKKLRKKVLSEFQACANSKRPFTEAELGAKFKKKISKNTRLRILKDRVKLIK